MLGVALPKGRVVAAFGRHTQHRWYMAVVSSCREVLG
jgi:hypothetical protein